MLGGPFSVGFFGLLFRPVEEIHLRNTAGTRPADLDDYLGPRPPVRRCSKYYRGPPSYCRVTEDDIAQVNRKLLLRSISREFELVPLLHHLVVPQNFRVLHELGIVGSEGVGSAVLPERKTVESNDVGDEPVHPISFAKSLSRRIRGSPNGWHDEAGDDRD